MNAKLNIIYCKSVVLLPPPIKTAGILNCVVEGFPVAADGILLSGCLHVGKSFMCDNHECCYGRSRNAVAAGADKSHAVLFS